MRYAIEKQAHVMKIGAQSNNMQWNVTYEYPNTISILRMASPRVIFIVTSLIFINLFNWSLQQPPLSAKYSLFKAV